MGRDNTVCTSFVLQTGPIRPQVTPKRVQMDTETHFFRKSAGQRQKQGLNALFSMTSVSHKVPGTRVGQVGTRDRTISDCGFRIAEFLIRVIRVIRGKEISRRVAKTGTVVGGQRS